MLKTLVKYIFIYYFCISICKNYYSFRFKSSYNYILSLVLSIFTYLLNLYFEGLNYTLPLLSLWLITSIINQKPQSSFVAIIISFTFSFCLNSLSSFVILLFTLPIFKNYELFPLLALLTGILQFLLIRLLFSIKRFKKTFMNLTSYSNINIATLFCILLVSLILYISFDYAVFKLQTFALLIFILTLAFLIYWWQAQITKAYRRSLELRELESMRTEMAELKIKMQELTDENERLARITHRDNTLISALKNSTVKYLSTDFANPAVALETRNQLIENINALSAGRSSLAEARKEQSARTFETGFSLLNTLLHEMDEKALEMNITFAVHMGTSLDDFVPGSVSEDDLVHTIDDLLKNAFKATTTCEKRVVQLQFYKLGKHLVVEVADNGIPFEVKSLVNMGMEKLTTYEDGSGIGLVDIWSTKEKYGATYHLDECVNASPFTKKISLTFDKKNRYSIRTLRKEEILQASRRADLQVYDYNE